MVGTDEEDAVSIRKDNAKLHLLFATTLICQVACWMLATPGPILRASSQGANPFSIAAAIQSCFVAFLVLFAVPSLVSLKLGLQRSNLGFRLGNWKLGLAILSIGIPVAAVSVFVGGNDMEMMAAYPWPGQWIGESVRNMTLWFAIYALYYLAFEFFYRGFILQAFRIEFGFWAAMWIQVSMSVMIHFGKPTPELLAAIPAGFLFGWVAFKTESLWYVFVLHWAIGVLNDLSVMHHKGWL